MIKCLSIFISITEFNDWWIKTGGGVGGMGGGGGQSMFS